MILKRWVRRSGSFAAIFINNVRQNTAIELTLSKIQYGKAVYQYGKPSVSII